MTPSKVFIEQAGPQDAAAICNLLNRSYRGETSRKGWTTEADLIGGEVRTDTEEVSGLLTRPESVFLIHRDADHILDACVHLQHRGQKAYLGMFAVEPVRQNQGLGKALLREAEGWANGRGCQAIFMYVISARLELITWYRRYGYKENGERVPFPEDGRSGHHLQPLEFIILEKKL